MATIADAILHGVRTNRLPHATMCFEELEQEKKLEVCAEISRQIDDMSPDELKTNSEELLYLTMLMMSHSWTELTDKKTEIGMRSEAWIHGPEFEDYDIKTEADDEEEERLRPPRPPSSVFECSESLFNEEMLEEEVDSQPPRSPVLRARNAMN